MGRILVGGASGRVGSRVVRHLAQAGVPLRLLYRRPAAGALPDAGPDSQVAIGDFGSPASMADAFAGIEAAFMYAPQAHADALFALARTHGVRHVVLLSSASVVKVPPGSNPIAERHRRAEQAIQAAGLAWTFVRPDTMASNCLAWAPEIRRDAVVRAPFAQSVRNPVHEEDLACLASRALTDPALAGRSFLVTGPAHITIAQQVQAIARQLGKALTCQPVTRDEALAAMTSGPGQMPDAVAQRLLDYLQKCVHAPPELTDDFQQVMGRAPLRFDRWVADNLHHFQA